MPVHPRHRLTLICLGLMGTRPADHGTPKIVACSLSRGRYVTRTTLVAGTPGRIIRPFAVELDPAALTRRIT